MAHITRRELKKDEFRETLAHGAEVALSHQQMIWSIGGAVLVVVLAVLGWRFYTQRETAKASAALADAMKVFHARIRPPGAPEEQGEITYVDDKNKYEDAAKKLAEVAQRYSRTRPGQMAGYYAALCQERLGRHAEAEKGLRQVERSSGNEDLVALARFQVAQIYEQTGRGNDAVKLYQQLISRPATMVPKPLALLALADYYRKNNPAEAIKLYTQIKTEFPSSFPADEAEKRLEALRPAS